MSAPAYGLQAGAEDRCREAGHTYGQDSPLFRGYPSKARGDLMTQVALRPSRTVVSVALAGAALTGAFAGIPFVRLAYRAPELHIALETASGAIGALAACLFCARFLRSGRSSDLALAWSLAVFAIA